MLASPSENAFSDPDWIYEIKWDGYRAIAELTDNFRLYSRNGLSFVEKYPPVTAALKEQSYTMILDGEIVAYDKKGQPSFQELQQYNDQKNTPLIYHVFDLLYLNGHNTKELPLLQRKELLKEALQESAHLRYCDHSAADGIGFFEAIIKNDLEGMVAKLKSSAYHIGTRSRQWLKIKHHNIAEAVIAGFTDSRGRRKGFGALILGNYQNGKLVYAGHIGTGFSEAMIGIVYDKMLPLVTKKCPFEEIPKTNARPTWLKPTLVCNLKYAEITKSNIYRHPVFLGLRIDKTAKKVDNSNRKTSKEIKLKKEKALPGKNKQIISGIGSDKDIITTIGNRKLKLTNLTKVYWPDDGYTKNDLIAYYQNISTFILPHLKDRPQSLHRFPNGIREMSFYQKDAGSAAPEWIQRQRVYSESNNKEIEYILCNNRAALAYLNNLGCIDLNPWNSRTKNITNPDYLIIDIDPSAKNSFEQVIETALVTKEVLDTCKAAAYCKTSGSSGMHVFVPMGAKYTYDQVKTFAHIIAEHVHIRLPKTTTLERNLKKRGTNKIYIDYLQNRSGQTIASVYSLRPQAGATVSMPLTWDEVEKGVSPTDFNIHNSLERIKENGDLFKEVLGKGIDMMKCIRLLEAKAK